jgi:hypothetical protein
MPARKRISRQRATNSHSLGEGKPFVASYSSKPTFTPCCACPPASSTPKASRPTSSSLIANRRRETLECEPHRRLNLWTYDLRTNKHFTLKESTLKRSDLDDLESPAAPSPALRVACYNPKNRHERKESERFKTFPYDELTKRDKLNLDIFWLKDESLEDSANLPDPDVIAQEIVEDLEAALSQFATIANDLKTN